MEDTDQSPGNAREEARKYARDHLVPLCREVLQWRKTGILPLVPEGPSLQTLGSKLAEQFRNVPPLRILGFAPGEEFMAAECRHLAEKLVTNLALEQLGYSQENKCESKDDLLPPLRR
jgi:hypothetical protein